MHPIVILAKLQIQFRDHAKVAKYYEQIHPKLLKVDGYEGVGLWQSATGASEFVALYHYASLDAAEKGLEVVASERMLAQSVPAQLVPPDVTRIELSKRFGRREPNAKIGDFLSVSYRVADPGYGDRLMEELDRIFDELSYIPGFLGAEYGSNQALPDEIVGIVSWESEAAFQTSVPPGKTYELSLYQRVV